MRLGFCLPRTPNRTNKDLDSGLSPELEPPTAELAMFEGVGRAVGTKSAVKVDEVVRARGVLMLWKDDVDVTCSLMSSERENRTNVLNDWIGATLGVEDVTEETREVVGVGHEKPVFIPELDAVGAVSASARVRVIVKYIVMVLHTVEGRPSGKSSAAAAASMDG